MKNSVPKVSLSEVLLPKAVADYIAATNAHDTKAIVAAFAETGAVHDEGKLHRGRDAIASWADHTVANYRMTMTPLAATEADGQTVVKARVSGTFPGSPLDLTFNFIFGADGIRELKVGA
ncbi:nuclear transport factor 2 family protein [Undibacter mobilis]|uniref:Nuclear transport factor 2 family protein n=1 Tax=Undibacter mobilis TaxID=2292256 RepID=A0A371B8U8_9BRAD|nr:nuclear transport factor 2 family protein [Undibacter mobilis]RDV03990.1 nuclear transport factor 2 family protein [Undibacter mobilis]